jgi:hypothetical protein
VAVVLEGHGLHVSPVGAQRFSEWPPEDPLRAIVVSAGELRDKLIPGPVAAWAYTFAG